MHIVIDIPEDFYEALKKTDEMTSGLHSENTLMSVVYSAVAKGTVLPKGYGRLGDLDALEKEMENGIRAGLLEEGYDNYPHINNVDDCVECVKYADTIIEADKEKKDAYSN